MADPSYAVNGFLGGEISQFAQGRWDLPSYKVSLNVCYNAFPVEIGAWVRRPGTQFAGATRGGLNGRVIKFDFQQSSAYTMEFTDGHLRFRSGATLVTNNDSQGVSSISTANPAVVTVATSPATGSTVIFQNLGTSCPLLQNRQFTWTHINGTTGSIADAITAAAIDGSTLGVTSLAATATMSTINDIATVYAAGAWSALRSVQTETAAFFLHSAFPTYELVVTSEPAGTAFAEFSLAQSFFEDGPYLDPFSNGLQATPNQTTGIVELTLSFPPYVSTTAYQKGAFVSSSSVNYISLVDQNVGNTPASSPSDWAATTTAAAVNNGQGFLQSDIGRLVRLFSEPANWSSTATYAVGNIVAYNPSGLAGGNVYYESLTASNVDNVPGTDAKNWELVALGSAQNPAIWTWGKITGLINFVPNAPSGVAQFGNMTGGGGLGAAFNGTTTQNAAASATDSITGTGGGAFTVNAYDGQNFSGCSPTGYAVLSATVFPSTDLGIAHISSGLLSGFGVSATATAYLYGSSTPPSSYNNGTLLGSQVIGSAAVGAFGTGPIGRLPINIPSSNTTTSYSYIWVAITIQVGNYAGPGTPFVTAAAHPAQIEFVSAGSATNATGINVELLGSPLLYTNVIATWRLGLYSQTTGFPNVGTYSDGRIWLSAPAFPNRIDASVANGINGVNNGNSIGSVNFAPTDQYGNVTDANAIDYTINSEGANPILWMQPTLQGIILETQAGEWLVNAPTSGGLSPTNISARKVTKIGGANVLPVTTEHTYVFVQRYSVKMMEYFADVFSGKFTAPNLADKAQHVTRNGIAELAYVHSATPIIWGRDTTGALFGCTYKRDTLMTSQGPTYYAWHRHALGSGRGVVSVTSGPSIGGNLDALTMVTADTSADAQAGVYHVEIMTDALDELSTLSQSWFLDDAVVPSSVSLSSSGATLNGLWHLNGEIVEVFCGGLDCGSYTVTNGSVVVPFGDGISAGTGGGLFTNTFAAANQTGFVVGFQYISQGQLVRPQDPIMTGTRLGPALGKKRTVKTASALFSNLGMSNSPPQTVVQLGTDFDGSLFPAILNGTSTSNPAGIPANQLSTFSGVWRDSIKSEMNFDGMLAWQVTGPLPCNIAVIQAWVTAEEVP